VSKIEGMFIHSRKEIQMIKNVKKIIAVLLMIALIVGLSGCKEGPFERAGKKVDKAVDDITK
jgi:hypothetical protein